MDAAAHRRFLRFKLAQRRLANILRAQTVCNARTLEQKISDAGPSNQRVDPHIITHARHALSTEGSILTVQEGGIPWYYLARTDEQTVKQRLAELSALHRLTQRHQFTVSLGQVLEIAVFRALSSQSALPFFGHFPDLDAHDDSTPYTKVEPPSDLSGRQIPSGKKLDFLLAPPPSGGSYAGIEAKNVREWFYPDRDEIREFLFKCCSLDVVPVLIARRIHYSTFSVLNPCGVILHQTFNQLYANSALSLAQRVRDKNTLGYHDVRVGNDPDQRLIRFIHGNLPKLLPAAREKFDLFKDLLWAYANGEHSYKSFAARVKRRLKGEPEDLPALEPSSDQTEEYEEPDEPAD